MEQVSVQNLIDAGVHFGCRASRWNPKMAPFIHGRRNRIHIIDLRQTMRGLIRAQNLLFRLASEGQSILWVGTKRQVKGVILDAGARTGMPVVTERWIGGTLTNFSVIRSRLRRLEELESIDEAKADELKLTKKELSSMAREQRKITRNLGGIREMGSVPAAMVVVDPSRESNAIREAKKMGLIVIGMLDTDCDPSDVDIVIPGNDDALKSVRLIVEHLAASVEEGAHQHTDQLRSAGGAEKQEETAPNPGGEPRPTTSRELPKRREDAAPTKDAAPAAEEAKPEAPKPEAPKPEAPKAVTPAGDAEAPKTDA
ncbi:MAG: 30S ribosomal protein S2 [bacterium]|nr:30S ribosomal protein S2 [bacterium]